MVTFCQPVKESVNDAMKVVGLGAAWYRRT